MAASPLVDENQLITLVGGPNDHLVVSFDKKTGGLLWNALTDPAVGYCPPVIFEFGRSRQLIVWSPPQDQFDRSTSWEVSLGNSL